MITCVVHYVIDPARIEAFERFAREWMRLVAKHGGIHHGYFLPAEGASVPGAGLRRRFLVDFTGGDLAALSDPAAIAVVAGTSAGRITATSLAANPEIGGFRAALDLELDAIGQTADLRAYLRMGERALTEGIEILAEAISGVRSR